MDKVVYIWTNTLTSDRYIGKGSVRRAMQHPTRALQGSSDCPRFYNALRHYGTDAFVLEYLAVGLDDKTSCRVEAAFIAMYGTRSEYNLTDGGDGPTGAVRTPEMRQRLSEAKKGKPGHPCSEETKARMREAITGQKRSPEVCANIGRAKLGTKHTDETKAKMSATRTGVPKSPETIEKVAAAHRGKKRSAETCARISAALLARRGCQ